MNRKIRKSAMLGAFLASAITSSVTFASVIENRDMAVSYVNDQSSSSGGSRRLIDQASDGEAPAMFAVGLMKYYGVAMDEDKGEGLSLITRSAKDGHLPAQSTLSFLVLEAGVSADIGSAEAASMKIKSAAGENITSQRIVGEMYMDGRALPRDQDLGMFWLSRAADRGDAVAQSRIRQEGRRSSSDGASEMTFDFISTRAKEGSVIHLLKLADLYDEGWVVQRDRRKAQRLRETGRLFAE